MITSSRYREHIVWGDEELKLKLLQRGILTRIYAPMVSTVINPNTLFLPSNSEKAGHQSLLLSWSQIRRKLNQPRT